MDEIELTIRLPKNLFDLAGRTARQRDATLDAMIRDTLAADLQRSVRRADQRRLDPLRALLSVDFARARSWQELQGRLMVKGYALREAGCGLALHDHPHGARVCSASDLGYSYGLLMRRLCLPFPGHSHRRLANRLLGIPVPDETQQAIRRG